MIMPSDKSMPAVEAMWHPKMGIYVTAQQMPMPKSNKVLQLWLIPKSRIQADAVARFLAGCEREDWRDGSESA